MAISLRLCWTQGKSMCSRQWLWQVRGTSLVNKLGPCPKATSWLLLWDKTVGQCLTFILSANGSPTAPSPLATQRDIHLFPHCTPPPPWWKGNQWAGLACLVASGETKNSAVKSFLCEKTLWVKNCRLCQKKRGKKCYCYYIYCNTWDLAWWN